MFKIMRFRICLAALALLGARTPAPAQNANPGTVNFVFRSDDEHVALTWSETLAADSPHLVLRTDADRVRRVDLMGNARSWPVVDGRTVLPLAEEPACLVLDGGVTPRRESSLITAVPPIAGAGTTVCH